MPCLVRDYSAFDKKAFENLLVNSIWEMFDTNQDTDEQWELILEKVCNILAIMCPLKKVNSCKNVIPWLTPDIYEALREKKTSVKKYKASRDLDDLREMRVCRNKVNSLIYRAKALYKQTT